MSVSEVTMVTILTSKTREKLPYQLSLSHEKPTTKGIVPHFHIKSNSRETSQVKTSTNLTQHVISRFITHLSTTNSEIKYFSESFNTCHMTPSIKNPKHYSGNTLNVLS